jgi:hypothetical protein
MRSENEGLLLDKPRRKDSYRLIVMSMYDVELLATMQQLWPQTRCEWVRFVTDTNPACRHFGAVRIKPCLGTALVLRENSNLMT